MMCLLLIQIPFYLKTLPSWLSALSLAWKCPISRLVSVVYFNFHNKILCRLLIGWLIVASSIVSIFASCEEQSLFVFESFHFAHTDKICPSVCPFPSDD